MGYRGKAVWFPKKLFPGIYVRDERPMMTIPESAEDKRSAMAVLAEKILRAVNDGHLSSAEASREFLKKRAEKEDGPSPFDSLIARESGMVRDFYGMKLITFGDRETAPYEVLYLHGGAYTEEILPFHLHFCGRLARRIGACVLVPLYPLAPNHIWSETYTLLLDLYLGMLAEKGKEITIMGDSAGGGLSIAFCQYLKTIGLPQPEHLIGLSPWVDVCMKDAGYEPYRPLDPMLDVPGLQVMGKAWAGDLDVQDPKVSPAFGDCHGLPRTLLFAGTREILYPDIKEFYEKMIREGCDAELVVGSGMNHVYPLYNLPESKPAVERIEREITGR